MSPPYSGSQYGSMPLLRPIGRNRTVAVNGTRTADGATLASPDGPFPFATITAAAAAIDAVSSPNPIAGQLSSAICRSTAAHCGTVQNNDGDSCQVPQPPALPRCWGRVDSSGTTPQFVPYSDVECRALCYAMNLFAPGSTETRSAVRNALDGAGLCVEEELVDFDAPVEDALLSTGHPIGRHLFGRLQYTCPDAASVVAKETTRVVGLRPKPGQVTPTILCHVTQRTEVTLRQETATRLAGSLRRTASLQPGDPAACANVDDPTNPLAQVLVPERMLFTLTR